jgi:hypothetical protein
VRSDSRTMRSSRKLSRCFIGPAFLLAAFALTGCGSDSPPEDRKPEFSTGEGAISGDVIGADHEPFDLELAGGQKAMKIELLSPEQGVAAVTYPVDKKAHFAFSHIPPGRYELTVFITITGKRSIAGNMPVVVDAEKITPATLMLTVTDISRTQ